MKISIFLLSFITVANAGIFDFFTGQRSNNEMTCSKQIGFYRKVIVSLQNKHAKKVYYNRRTEVGVYRNIFHVHITHRDSGELNGSRGNPNIGEEIEVHPDGSGNHHLGDEIIIPNNRVQGHEQPGRTEHRTSASLPSFSLDPLHDTKNGCPNRVDAFCSGEKFSYLFSGMQVYFIQDDRIRSSTAIRSAFPSGPNTVDAAVYDNERELLVLINGRNVYGYKQLKNTVFKLDSSYPKKLPSALFPPSAAVRWHDKHQMLLSNGGKFALYDEYWNKSLMTGRTTDYFKGLPHNVRGISSWKNGKARIYTKNLVFIYDISLSTTIADGVPIPRFLKCQ